MATYKITFSGLPQKVIKVKGIEIELEEDSGLRAIVDELKRRIPEMDGTIVVKGESKLSKHYIFNVNGRFHFSDDKINVSTDDHVILMILPLGG